MRRFIVGFFSLFMISFLTTSALAGPSCSPVRWGRIATGDFVSDRAMVLVDVTIEGLSGTLPMQLDTGSSRTYISPSRAPKSASPEGFDARVSIPGMAQRSLQVKILKDTSTSGNADQQSNGTLGIDYFPDGLILDLKHQRLCVLDKSLVAQVTHWTPLTKLGGSPVITVNDGTKDLKLLLDTGSSAFSVLSTPSHSRVIADARPIKTFSVPSFGRMLSINERAPTGHFGAFGQRLNIPRIYVFNDFAVGLLLRARGIDGLMGLSPFAEGALVFDFKSNQIGYRDGGLDYVRE